jgi:predicted dehydrogenase
MGTAQIARKNWKAIWNTGNAVVAAVASRDPMRCRQFVSDCQAEAPFAAEPRALCSYEELLGLPDLDAIYIPLPTGVRKEWVVRAAQAGKHILCEKPCACSAADLREMLDACRRHGVLFMDGVMFMHSRRLAEMRRALDDGTTVGRVKRVTTSFSVALPEDVLRTNIRGEGRLEPYGCLGDLGWYCIRFSLWAMNWKMPCIVTARDLSRRTGPAVAVPGPTEFSAELLFEGGESASIYCSFVSADEQWANICGTASSLYVPDFVLPFHGENSAYEVNGAVFNVNGCDFEMEPRRTRILVAEHSNSHPTAQETNMFRSYSERISMGAKEDGLWPEISMKTQQVLDACRDSARALSSGQVDR